MDGGTAPLVVVDAANTVGSVPDGWWRDRQGATERVRDALAALARTGLPERADVPEWARRAPLDIVLVVEGAARGVAPAPGVRVEAAAGSGDDLIAQLVADRDPQRLCLVVTADRELRRRVTAHGAAVTGPRSVRA
ncbi:NTP pyrophosphohydrolase [Actinacidiphila sp. bgisy167]|uniref:NTP pyrophosphohydrolase n=1 Tax=Actinacidiphila sp. bgisy167 TaxID=3413797 RepID=UPI003D756E67